MRQFMVTVVIDWEDDGCDGWGVGPYAKAFGPFSNEQDADAWARTHLGPDDFRVVPMFSPEEFLPEERSLIENALQGFAEHGERCEVRNALREYRSRHR